MIIAHIEEAMAALEGQAGTHILSDDGTGSTPAYEG